jgi:hypothetical protein
MMGNNAQQGELTTKSHRKKQTLKQVQGDALASFCHHAIS